MVEFAVVLPLLLVVMLGMIDFGRATFEAVEVESAAHAGAAYGARSKGLAADKQGIEKAVLDDMGDEADTESVGVVSERYCECSDGSSIDCDAACPGGEASNIYVRVRVGKSFVMLFDYPGVASDLQLRREVHLRVR